MHAIGKRSEPVKPVTLYLVRMLVVLALWLLTASSAWAQAVDVWHRRQAFATSFEAWAHPANRAGHGVVLLTMDAQHGDSGTRVGLVWNTDTLRAWVDDVRLRPWLVFGARGTAEFVFAGLMPDYYVNGRLEREAGFAASYVQLESWLRAQHDRHFVEANVGARAWRFDRLPATAADLGLPGVRRVFEPRLRYTYWGVSQDISLWEQSRLFRRVHGLAAGAELAADIRDNADPWGRYEGVSQQPARTILRGSLWAEAGWAPTERLRWQWALAARTADGDDALTASRVGGLGPYVVPVAGLPWAAVIDDQYFSGRTSIHLDLVAQHEWGAALDVVSAGRTLRDTSSQNVLWGGSLFADLRWQQWQVDVRTGLSPSWVQTGVSASAWLGFGYSW